MKPETKERSRAASERFLKPGGEFIYGTPVTRPYSQLLEMLAYYSGLGFTVLPKFDCEHCGNLVVADTPNKIPPWVFCPDCEGEHCLRRSGGNIVVGFNGTKAEFESKIAQIERDHGPVKFYEGTEGQDRESYTDTQDRDSYTVDED